MRVWIALVVVAATAQAASAAPGGVVLESYTGDRPDDATRLLSPLLDELAKRGVVGGYDVVGRKYEAEVSRPTSSPEGLTPDFADRVERGHKAWIEGKFDEAVSLLSPMIEAAHANPGAFAQNQPLRERLLKGLIALALSQQRMGDPSSSRTTFGEILRSFPDTQLSRATYGPDAYNQFEEVRRAATTRGRLTVKVPDESGVVFINEHFENVGTTSKADLVPGDYRVYVQLGKQLTRSHTVIVRGNQETTLALQPAYDAAIRTTPHWTGLGFATQAERERNESAFAAKFAREIAAGSVIVIGFDQSRGRASIVGSIVSLDTGREIRRASLALEPEPPVERVRALARFLAGDQATNGIDVQLGGDVRVAAPKPNAKPESVAAAATPEPAASAPEPAGNDRAATHDGPWGGWKYVTGGLAVGALATGVTLFALDGQCSVDVSGGLPCPMKYDNHPFDYIAVGAGVALAGVTLYLFLHHPKHAPTNTAYVVPTRDGAFAGYRTAQFLTAPRVVYSR